MKNIVLVLGTLIVFGGGYYWFSSNGVPTQPSSETPTFEVQGEEHQITLTENGFVPDEITIARGDTVTWSATTGRLFWPASNLHPSHRDYPGGLFDPKQPIPVGESWGFTFGEAGNWKYHDHLAPYYTGIVHVIE